MTASSISETSMDLSALLEQDNNVKFGNLNTPNLNTLAAVSVLRRADEIGFNSDEAEAEQPSRKRSKTEKAASAPTPAPFNPIAFTLGNIVQQTGTLENPMGLFGQDVSPGQLQLLDLMIFANGPSEYGDYVNPDASSGDESFDDIKDENAQDYFDESDAITDNDETTIEESSDDLDGSGYSAEDEDEDE